MLSGILNKEDCANCRFCCSFRRVSLWELPKLPESFLEKYGSNLRGEKVNYIINRTDDERWAVTDLTGSYRTDDPDEEAPCPFLDPEKGCTLPPEDKPFECSAWPLRYMKMPDGTRKVCLTPTCPSMNRIDTDILKEAVRTKWGRIIRDQAQKTPYIVQDYKDGYIVLE